MSVNALKPNFHDQKGYLAWCSTWRKVYRELSERILAMKNQIKDYQNRLSSDALTGHGINQLAEWQKALPLWQADATKMMTLLREAKLLRDRIREMHQQIANQGFPIDLGDCRNIDVHFNKISIQFPFMPKWVMRARGKSYYINHIDASVPWSTRELDEGSTRGMIRFKRAQVEITSEGVARLTEREAVMA